MNYSGGCHCGNVRYDVSDVDLTKPVIVCNCSICGRSGTMLAFVPEASFRLVKGEDALTDYQFNKNVIHHLFCSTCGIKSFARGQGPDGKPMAAINIRCLDGVDPDTVPVHKYDGATA